MRTPIIEFSADNDTIHPGQSTKLRWHIENVRAIYLDRQPLTGPRGEKEIWPAKTTTYTLEVHTDSGVEYPRVTVTVAQPVVTITNVTLSPTTLHAGEMLNVSITVRNDTNQTLRTTNPQPGFVYQEEDTFRTLGYMEQADCYRVGLDFDGRAGVDHPYRWGLGRSLLSGEEATITGQIRLTTAKAVYYSAGLVHEGKEWLETQKGQVQVTVQGHPIDKRG